MSETVTLTVNGMKCGGCENAVTTKLKALPGVKSASASSKDKRVNVDFDPKKTDPSEIAQAIAGAGYTVVD